MTLIIISCILLGGLIGYGICSIGREKEIDFVYMKSELSDPSVNLTPVGFGRPHIQILEVIKSKDPHEMTRRQINLSLGKSKNHAYERQLWQWGYVNRREIPNPFGQGKIHFYTLTQKGKEVLSNNHKF